jgi:hypothetical protein
MRLVINVVLLLGGIVITGVGFALTTKSPLNWIIVALGVGLLLLALYFDKNRVKQRDTRVADEIKARIATLTKKPWMRHEQLQVPQNRTLVVYLLFIFLSGGGSAWLGFHVTPINWKLVLGGFVLLGMVVLSSPSVLIGIGKSALVLSRSGFETPIDGLISWQYVEGIYLQVVTTRGVRSYSLILRVPEYAKAVASIHWVQRWLALFGLGAFRRGLLSVSLKGGQDQPETIEAVARHLWKTATGRDYVWNPNMSQEANDAYRRMALLGNKVADNGRVEEDLQVNPELAIKDLQQFDRDMTLIKEEVSQKSRMAKLMVIIAIVGIALTLAWPWFKRWH